LEQPLVVEISFRILVPAEEHAVSKDHGGRCGQDPVRWSMTEREGVPRSSREGVAWDDQGAGRRSLTLSQYEQSFFVKTVNPSGEGGGSCWNPEKNETRRSFFLDSNMSTVTVEVYSEKAIVVRNALEHHGPILQGMNGMFNDRLKGGRGWIFPKYMLSQIGASSRS
jgi:hypothetical protein